MKQKQQESRIIIFYDPTGIDEKASRSIPIDIARVKHIQFTPDGHLAYIEYFENNDRNRQ